MLIWLSPKAVSAERQTSVVYASTPPSTLLDHSPTGYGLQSISATEESDYSSEADSTSESSESSGPDESYATTARAVIDVVVENSTSESEAEDQLDELEVDEMIPPEVDVVTKLSSACAIESAGLQELSDSRQYL